MAGVKFLLPEVPYQMWRSVVFLAFTSTVFAQKQQHIVAGDATQGWCFGFDQAPAEKATTAAQCWSNCRNTHKVTIAVDFYPGRPSGQNCWCQDACDCLTPSRADGGQGILVTDDTLSLTKATCYRIKAGKGAHGYCAGSDTPPVSGSSRPLTPKQCFDYCKKIQPGTVAVDFFDINHPYRTLESICWCQDACGCTKPSISDGGDGVLYVADGTTIIKGGSCGQDMRTIVEGNDNSVCNEPMVDASKSTKDMYACQEQCTKDGFNIANYFSDEKACKCQAGCLCTKAGPGRGHRFIPESLGHVQMCASQEGSSAKAILNNRIAPPIALSEKQSKNCEAVKKMPIKRKLR